jgi:pimeloyl-ACP methyl ester carboxylesterase
MSITAVHWKQGIKLHKDFASKLPKNVPVFLSHSENDQEIPVNNLELYAQHMPQTTVRKITSRGHQLNHDLSLIA